MKWVDEANMGLGEQAKVGIFDLWVWVEHAGGWFAKVAYNGHRVSGSQGGPFDSMATAKRAAVRSINTIIQAAKGDLLDDDEGAT